MKRRRKEKPTTFRLFDLFDWDIESIEWRGEGGREGGVYIEVNWNESKLNGMLWFCRRRLLEVLYSDVGSSSGLNSNIEGQGRK